MALKGHLKWRSSPRPEASNWRKLAQLAHPNQMLDAPTTPCVDTHQPDANHLGCYCNSTAWAVAHTHPQAEDWAEKNLRRRGYQVYLPTHVVRIRDRVTRTITRDVERPLFTGYVFVLHVRSTSWRPIYETPGVHSLIRNGNQLQYARSADIRMLQATADARGYLPAENTQWAPGMACGLANGSPLCSLPAFITEVHTHSVSIAVMFLGQIRHLRNVPVHQLVPRAEP